MIKIKKKRGGKGEIKRKGIDPSYLFRSNDDSGGGGLNLMRSEIGPSTYSVPPLGGDSTVVYAIAKRNVSRSSADLSILLVRPDCAWGDGLIENVYYSAVCSSRRFDLS